MRRALAMTLAALAAAAGNRPAAAERVCGAEITAASAHHPWPAPLDRAVTFRARDVSLREALDRLSAAAHVPLSYSSDLLPLDRRVCLAARAVPLGDALSALLSGTGAEPAVVAGQVVLAPARAGAADRRAGVADRVNPLETIVVTGTPVAAERRSITVGLDVIDGRDLSRRRAESLPDVLNASVPGVWAWRTSPSSLLAQYGSVRGASSFGATYPKVYVDGVEAANPLLITDIDPDEVERVEVIRGPQGAALYGSDAISGIINIVTRNEGSDGDGPFTAELRSSAGVAGSAFASHPPPTYEHRLSLRTGSNLGSAGLALRLDGTGGIYPGAASHRFGAAASARRVTSNAVFSGSFRFSDRRAGSGTNPLLAGYVQSDTTPGRAALGSDPDSGESVRHYTFASSATVSTGGLWTHQFLVGVDGYRLDYLPPDSGRPIPMALDSALRAARGAADRATLRASSSLRLGEPGSPAEGTLTFAYEQSILRQRSERENGLVSGPETHQRMQTLPAPANDQTQSVVSWRHDAGILAQASGSWRSSLYGTAGVRFERSDAFTGVASIQALPMLGAAWTRAVGAAEVKLRAAYGRGIRAPQTPARDHLRPREDFASLIGLDPEAQSGIELGAEVWAGRTFSLQATRFDQQATGLIQDVLLGVDTVYHDQTKMARLHYEPQNVGAIGNRGWEMQAGLARGPLALNATLSLVDSRVERLAPGYAGDLLAGARMLAVPARTATLTAQWDAGAWTGSVTAARAWDWVNYDRLAIARDLASGAVTAHELAGARLRTYWRAYDGSTDLRAAFSRQLSPRFWLDLKADNLLGGQLGEPDDVSIRAGRSLSIGGRATF